MLLATGSKLSSGWVLRFEFLNTNCHLSTTKLCDRRRGDKAKKQATADAKPTPKQPKPTGGLAHRQPGLASIPEEDTDDKATERDTTAATGMATTDPTPQSSQASSSHEAPHSYHPTRSSPAKPAQSRTTTATPDTPERGPTLQDGRELRRNQSHKVPTPQTTTATPSSHNIGGATARWP